MAEKEENVFKKDPSGLMNYFAPNPDRNCLAGAIKVALKNKPEGPACFWFNGFPVPIAKNDTENSLVSRFHKFERNFRENPLYFLAELEKFAKNE